MPTTAPAVARRVRLASVHIKTFYAQKSEEICTDIQKSAKAISLQTSGTIRLPTRRKFWSVLRSPFVHKKHFDQVRSRGQIHIYFPAYSHTPASCRSRTESPCAVLHAVRATDV